MNNLWKETQIELTHAVTELEETLKKKWKELPPSEKMKVDAHHRFISGFKNYIKDFIEEHDLELVKNHILFLRKQIENLWQQCCFTDLQKEEFREFNSLDFSNELLNKHRQYLSSLELLYDNNKTVFDSAKKYSDLWDHLQDLEKQENDPNKFNNRGALLLKNEKERKEGKKELIRLASELVALATQHEEKFGKKLNIHGLPVESWLERFKAKHKDLSQSVNKRIRPWQAGMANQSASTAKKRQGLPCSQQPTAKNCKRSLSSKEFV